MFSKVLLTVMLLCLASKGSDFKYQMLVGELQDSNGDPVLAHFRVTVPPSPGSTGPSRHPTHGVTANNYYNGKMSLFRVFEEDESGTQTFIPILLVATITEPSGPRKIFFRFDREENLLKKQSDLKAEGFSLQLSESDQIPKSKPRQ